MDAESSHKTPDFQPGEIIGQIGTIIRGKEAQVRLALTCLFARGHLLIEDLPGIGKTTLAKALGDSIIDDIPDDTIRVGLGENGFGRVARVAFVHRHVVDGDQRDDRSGAAVKGDGVRASHGVAADATNSCPRMGGSRTV